MRNTRTWVLSVMLVGTLAACERPAEEETTADQAAVPDTTTAAAPVPEPVKIELDEVADSNIEGEVTATHSASEVTVSIVLTEGGKTEVSYPAHIHTGTCEKGGPVTVELAPVTNLQSSKTVPASALPVNQDAFVQVHDPSGKPIACGDLKGHGDSVADTTRDTTTTR